MTWDAEHAQSWLEFAVSTPVESCTETAAEDINVKETVRDLLERLPDDCSLEDVVYHLYVLHELQLGRADMKAGRTLSPRAGREELRRKWLLGATG